MIFRIQSENLCFYSIEMNRKLIVDNVIVGVCTKKRYYKLFHEFITFRRRRVGFNYLEILFVKNTGLIYQVFYESVIFY